MNYEVYLWNGDKHQCFLQVSTVIFGMHVQACPKYLKQDVFLSLQYLGG